MAFEKVDNPKTLFYKLRLTEEEKTQLTAKAAECAMPLSQYLLAAGLGRRTRARSDVEAINLLRGIAADIKALHSLTPPSVEPQLQRALDEVVAAIARVWSGASQ